MTLAEQIAEAQRELALRRKCYPLPKPCHDFLYISGAFRRLYPVGSAVGLLW
jgi:hypothetical protein